jgi:hypothetical protein
MTATVESVWVISPSRLEVKTRPHRVARWGGGRCDDHRPKRRPGQYRRPAAKDDTAEPIAVGVASRPRRCVSRQGARGRHPPAKSRAPGTRTAGAGGLPDGQRRTSCSRCKASSIPSRCVGGNASDKSLDRHYADDALYARLRDHQPRVTRLDRDRPERGLRLDCGCRRRTSRTR